MSDESKNQPKDQKPTNQGGSSGNGGVFSGGHRGEIPAGTFR